MMPPMERRCIIWQQSYNRSGDTDKAVETYKKVIELFPNTEKARKSENYIKELEG